MAKDCEIAAIEDVDFSTYFTTIRQLEYANSWRGIEEERADLAENYCNSDFHRMEEDIIQLIARYEVWMRNLAIIDNVVQRFNALELKKFIEVVTPNSPFSCAYTASAPGEPGDPGSGGSVTCFEDDEAALPQKEIIKQGNIHFFRDMPPLEKSTLAIKSIEKKELVSYGNIHFFKDIILREESPRVSVVLKPRHGL